MAMGSDVIHKCLHLLAKVGIGDDLVNETHEDLWGVAVAKGHTCVHVEAKGADEGSFLGSSLGKWDLPESRFEI